MPKKPRLTQMIDRTSDVAADLNRLHFSSFQSPQGWVPEINAFRYDDRFEIWVELAGVEKEQIKVDVLTDRVRISGTRKSPTPRCDESNQCRQVLAMEIESGKFGREILIPGEIDRHEVTASQNNGLLHIILPLVQSDQN